MAVWNHIQQQCCFISKVKAPWSPWINICIFCDTVIGVAVHLNLTFNQVDTCMCWKWLLMLHEMFPWEGPLWQCNRFIKKKRPSFTTSIIKDNPVVFLSEILNVLQPAVERQILVLTIDGGLQPTNNILNVIYVHFLPLNAADIVLGKTFKGIWLSLQQHQTLKHNTTTNGLLQECMLN